MNLTHDEPDTDMLDTIINVLNELDHDRMASFIGGLQDALNGVLAVDNFSMQVNDDYAAGHARASTSMGLPAIVAAASLLEIADRAGATLCDIHGIETTHSPCCECEEGGAK